MNPDSSWDILQKELLISFLPKVRNYLQELNVLSQVEMLQADHLGLRFKNIETIENLKKELGKVGKMISSAVVNGRKIFIFELNNPLIFGDWHIPCIELPYPKEKQEYADGWEHIEFVIPSNASSLENFKKDFMSFLPLLNIDKLIEEDQYSESVPKVEIVQLPNPSILLNKSLNLTIKFHPKPIKDIVS
jgi:predicted metalloenzyme YecM